MGCQIPSDGWDVWWCVLVLMATVGYGMMQNYVHTNTHARFAESLKIYGRYQACSGGGCVYRYPEKNSSDYETKCVTTRVTDDSSWYSEGRPSLALWICSIVGILLLVACCIGIGVKACIHFELDLLCFPCTEKTYS